MSFSSEVKQELCRITDAEHQQLYAECYGMLLFARSFSLREIIFKTENANTATRFEFFLSQLFNPILEKQSSLKIKNSSTMLYKVSVISSDECKKIYENFGHSSKDIKLMINRANIDGENCYQAFLRGVFLSCGSVTDPNKSYHLELNVQHKTLAENLILLINEIEVLNFKPKLAQRKGGYVVYIKGNNEICDFLGYIGAGNSVMRIIEVSAVKDIRNKINRQRNSEIANITKLASASAKQITAIKKISDTKGLDSLSADLKQLAILRLNNPEMSLKELGESLDPPISRSGVNHRIERILKIADSLQEEI
jgi:hypothetical protein